MNIMLKRLLPLFLLLFVSCSKCDTIIGSYSVKYKSRDLYRRDSYYQMDIYQDSMAVLSSCIFSCKYLQSVFKMRRIGDGVYELYDNHRELYKNIPLIIKNNAISVSCNDRPCIAFKHFDENYNWYFVLNDSLYSINNDDYLTFDNNQGEVLVFGVWNDIMFEPINDTIWCCPFKIDQDACLEVEFDSFYSDMAFYIDSYKDTVIILSKGAVKLAQRNHIMKNNRKSRQLNNIDMPFRSKRKNRDD